MSDISKLTINGERLWQSLMDLAKIGATPKGGNCRLALSPLDGQGRDLVVGWMKDAGLEITVDQIGKHLRTPAWAPAVARARGHRQPYRHAAHRRKIRRLFRRHGGAGSHANPQ